MAKLVDATGLGPVAVKRRVGSSPISRTNDHSFFDLALRMQGFFDQFNCKLHPFGIIFLSLVQIKLTAILLL